ncbi:MAG: hypothetical protein HPY57_14875 [Ignavibacteria bacterium]|nr:hypothetical protein [Ignavibacteria bacterium]
MEKKLKNIQTFEQHTDKKLNISDVISSEKINKLKEIGFTNSEINELINFLSMSDEEISKVKLTSLEGAPKKIKNLYDGGITSF